MTEYRHGAHSVFMIHVHLVWITKYRKGVLKGDVAYRVRGYFCCSSGNVTDDVIREYLERQDHDIDSEFRIEGEGSPSS